jgi:hypothetical protein
LSGRNGGRRSVCDRFFGGLGHGVDPPERVKKYEEPLRGWFFHKNGRRKSYRGGKNNHENRGRENVLR